MRSMLDAQRAAFMAALLEPLRVRRDRLSRAAAMISDHAERLCDALSEDFGDRSREQSMMTDIASSVAPIRHALKRLDAWAKPEKRRVQFPLSPISAKAHVEYQPKGCLRRDRAVELPREPCHVLAAGDRAMVKLRECTPATGSLMAELACRYCHATELAFVSGGPEIGRASAELPFDHLIFTGATGISRHILHAAADNLVPVTLELGGKSPVIVGESANITQATGRMARGKMLNPAQICLTPDYMLAWPEQ